MVEILKEDTKTFNRKTLYRLKMTEDHPKFAKYKDKLLGGYVSEESVIENGAWVEEGSYVMGNTVISGDIIVKGESRIKESKIDGDGTINQFNIINSEVSGLFRIDGNGSIKDSRFDGVIFLDLLSLGTQASRVFSKCSVTGVFKMEIYNVVKIENCIFNGNFIASIGNNYFGSKFLMMKGCTTNNNVIIRNGKSNTRVYKINDCYIDNVELDLAYVEPEEVIGGLVAFNNNVWQSERLDLIEPIS